MLDEDISGQLIIGYQYYMRIISIFLVYIEEKLKGIMNNQINILNCDQQRFVVYIMV